MIPDLLEPDLCPGGIVFRVYADPNMRLLIEQRVHWTDDIEVAANASAEQAVAMCPHEDFVLVGYDGDSGEMMMKLAVPR